MERRKGGGVGPQAGAPSNKEQSETPAKEGARDPRGQGQTAEAGRSGSGGTDKEGRRRTIGTTDKEGRDHTVTPADFAKLIVKKFKTCPHYTSDERRR